MKEMFTNHRSATKVVRDNALFAAAAYHGTYRRRSGWRHLNQAEMAINLLESAIQDIRESVPSRQKTGFFRMFTQQSTYPTR